MNINLMADLYYIRPEIIVTIVALLVLVWDFASGGRVGKEKLAGLSIAGLVLAMAANVTLLGEQKLIFSQLVAVDYFAILYKFVFLGTAILVIAISTNYMKLERASHGEYYALILFATLGAMIMAAGTNFITIYLGVELTALPTYILCGFITHDRRSNESAIKYFILGVLASAIMAYGVSLIYGATGSVNLYEIKQVLAQITQEGGHAEYKNAALVAGVALLVAGFAFKIAAVPFHMWAPDVYEGAPTSVTAFMSVVPKAASFAALVRVFAMAVYAVKLEWGTMFSILAVLTVVLGNFMALTQDSVKRMLAYSGIAHVGYALIGVVSSVASQDIGVSSVLLYFLVYFVGQVGAFAVIIFLSKGSGVGESYEDFKGLAKLHPGAAFMMTIFILSLIGIPPTGGFVAKFWVFAAAVKAGYLWLGLVGVLSAVVSCYYYLKVIMFMYMYEPVGQVELPVTSRGFNFVMAIMAIITVYMGINPAPFMELAQKSLAAVL